MENEVKTNVAGEPAEPKMREIIIQTDGKNIFLKKAEASIIELTAILSMIVTQINKKPEEEKKEESPKEEKK